MSIRDITNWGITALEILSFFMLCITVFKCTISYDCFRITLRPTVLIILAGFFVYVLGHITSYLFVFSDAESAGLAAFGRYLMLYMCIMLAFPIYILFAHIEKVSISSYIQYTLSFSSIAFIILSCNIPWTVSQIFYYNSNSYTQSLLSPRTTTEEIIQPIADCFIPATGYIWIGTSADSYNRNVLTYVLSPSYTLEGSFFINIWENVEEIYPFLDRNDNYTLLIQNSCFEDPSSQRKITLLCEHLNIDPSPNTELAIYQIATP